MGKKKGFSRLFLLFAVVVMMGGCAGKSSSAQTPQDESDVSSTLAQEVLSDPVESTQDVREQDAPSSDSEPETVSESESVSDLVSEPEVESKSETESKSAVESKPGTESKPAAESKPGAESKPAAESKPGTESKPAAESNPGTESEPAAESNPETESKPVEESKPGAESEPAAESKPETESEPAEVSEPTKSGFVLWSPDSGFVPENGRVDDSYFSDALFVGDSRMQGFVLYSGLSNVKSYTSVGLAVDTAYSKKFVQLDGKELTLAEALQQTAPNFGKIYLLFGMNELGWGTWSVFVSKYGGLIDLIQQANPNAVIYLESLIPLTAEKSAKSDWLNNDHVNSFNKMIWQLAADKGVYYLNTAAGLAGEDGTLPSDASTDGVHLNKEACGKWLEYLKTHTAGAGS